MDQYSQNQQYSIQHQLTNSPYESLSLKKLNYITHPIQSKCTIR